MVDAEPGGHAWAEPFEHDVSAVSQGVERISSAGVLQVECDRPLATIQSLVERRQHPGGVGGVRAFDDDDISTEIRQHHPCERARIADGEADDAATLKLTAHRRYLARDFGARFESQPPQSSPV